MSDNIRNLSEPKTDQVLWDELKTKMSSFDMLMKKYRRDLKDAELRWLTVQLSRLGREINSHTLELNERAQGHPPKRLAP